MFLFHQYSRHFLYRIKTKAVQPEWLYFVICTLNLITYYAERNLMSTLRMIAC